MLSDDLDRLEDEFRRLNGGVQSDEMPEGLGTVRFVVECPGNAAEVADHAKQVLLVVNQNSRSAWPTESEWFNLLPDWFVAACAPEMTQGEAEDYLTWWKSLPDDEQVRVKKEQRWSVQDWLYWLHPDERAWYWWDALDVDANALIVAVVIYDWPFPWDALEWLLRSAGATRVDSEE